MTFEDQHHRRFILFVKIVMPSQRSGDIKARQRAASYEAPVLIDSELSGEASALSWEEAAGLMKSVAPWVDQLSPLHLEWFDNLNDVIGRHGRPLSP